MKKLILGIILLASSAVHAQESPTPETQTIKITVACSSQAKILDVIKKYGERPMLQMTSARENKELVTIMFVNPKTLSYTIVEKVNDDVYCVTGSGEGVMVYMRGDEISASKPPKY